MAGNASPGSDESWIKKLGGLRTAQGFHLAVDDPLEWSLRDPRVHVRGWCVHETGEKPTGIRISWEGGQAIGRYGEPRPDVRSAFSLPKELENCGFKISLALPRGKTLLRLEVCNQAGEWQELVAWEARVSRLPQLSFLRGRFAGDDPPRDYPSWIDQYERPNRWQHRTIVARGRAFAYQPFFSVLLPTYNTPVEWLTKAIESIRRQSYSNWELCVSDDASTDVEVHDILRRYQLQDKRIKVHFRKENGHISASSNSALELATGEFVVLLDHDDELSIYALFAAALELNRSPGLDVIFSDEDKIDQHGWRFDPHFKSDWNRELLNAQNCVSHIGIFRTSKLREIGGFQVGVEGCQDWDVALRISEGINPDRIRHIPRVLYHWRAIPGSTALALDEKSYIGRSAKRMLADHFARQATKVEIAPVEGGHWGVKYGLEKKPLVSIIIPTRNQAPLLRRCLASIAARTTYENYELLIVDNDSDEPRSRSYLRELKESGARLLSYNQPFNYSAINNFAVKHARGELICFLNNDMEVISPRWLEEMVSHALRPGVGAVGAKLLFPDGTFQHTGVVLGLGGPAGHILYKFHSTTGGYYNHARLVCDYTAVTAACMVLRKSIFLEAGGFDAENLPVSYNDVDLCIRIRELGYRNVYTPFAELYHHESASRGQDSSTENRDRATKEINYMWRTWGAKLLHDPYYNPNLSLAKEDYSLAFPPRVRPLWKERAGDMPLSEADIPMPESWIAPPPSASPALSGRITTSAVEVITAVYKQVLGRDPDVSGLLGYAQRLQEGETVQAVVLELALSEEFRHRAIDSAGSTTAAVVNCYERLLARAPDEEGLMNLALAAEQSWEPVLVGFVESAEYEQRFGPFTIPAPDHAPEARLTWSPLDLVLEELVTAERSERID